ncbi:MAG TPA: ATPase, T2SS/T4P/T4SS family, partial [Syntrophomonadaceae bacterium]|nr:ATPase, T2SS/T4P/T4SS family [Syntrophomonadaceae bacterium]
MLGQRKMIGEIICEMGFITKDQLESALTEQKETGEKLGRLLINKGILTEQQLLEILELVLGIPKVQISKLNIDPETVKLLPPQLLRMHSILPVSRKKNNLTLAMADPLNQQAIDDVRLASGLDVIPVLASEKDLEIAIRQYLSFRLDPNMERILEELQQDEKSSDRRDHQPVRVDDDAPIIRVVNSILVQAVHGHCSDIHVEPRDGDLRIRYRVDGELYEVLTLPKVSAGAVISRIKIMANLDIAEKRIPQDGRFRMNVEGREVDFRVSTLPIIYGEKIVLRILDRSNALTRVDQLGLTGSNRKRLLGLSHRPYGMLLVTGPTGSGKTTTLYSLLNKISTVEKNIITLEDPVEYSLPGINQTQINPKAGLTFASGLRSILRQDPNVIMVGEIRDHETAQLAVQAALTGHLVLSTLHTNSAAGAIARLTDMGIES